MNKVAIKVVREEKIDGRKNNTGRPVNANSARQIRLNKQAAVKEKMDYVMNGGWFKLNANESTAYTFVKHEDKNGNGGHIATMFGGHECNINKIGRTKMSGYSFVMHKQVNIEFDVRNIIKAKNV